MTRDRDIESASPMFLPCPSGEKTIVEAQRRSKTDAKQVANRPRKRTHLRLFWEEASLGSSDIREIITHYTQKNMNQDIEQAIDAFRCRAARYAKNERYYRGDHDLAFATEKFANAFGALFREFALNLCPAVCDAVKDKLRITGFSVRSAGSVSSPTVREGATLFGCALTDVRASAAPITNIWDGDRMDIRSGEVHKEALRNGDAYVIVWPDADGRPVMHPNRASSCVVFYDDETPGKVIRAAKYWRTHGKR